MGPGGGGGGGGGFMSGPMHALGEQAIKQAQAEGRAPPPPGSAPSGPNPAQTMAGAPPPQSNPVFGASLTGQAAAASAAPQSARKTLVGQ